MITDFLFSLVIQVMSATGYTGLFVLSLVESAGIPVPSEIVLPFSGFLIASGQFLLWPAVLLATLGNVVGSVILFWIGASGGRWFLEKYGKYVLIHHRDIEKGEAWFKRHGNKAVFFGRMMPIVRTFISLPAGVAQMNFKKFIVFTTLGALPWNFALVYLGLKAGENWEMLRSYFHIVDIVIGVGIVIFIIWHVYNKQKQEHV